MVSEITNTASISQSSKKERNWSAVIAEWKSSGLSQKAFCARKRIALATFGYHRKKLKGKKNPLPRLLPVKVEPSQEKQLPLMRLVFPNGIQLILNHERPDCLSTVIKLILGISR